jgi:hypothetical protein
MPVILAIQEAEIRMIAVRTKPAQANSSRNPISKKSITKKSGGRELVEWLKV